MKFPGGVKSMTYADALSMPDISVKWIIDPLIADADRVVVYGEWGSMKSFWLIYVALCLASGKPMPGLPDLLIPTPRRVLYIDEEMGEPKMRRRLLRLAAGLGLTDTPLPLEVFCGTGLKFTPQDITSLVEWMAQNGYTPGDVVIYESLRRGIKGTELDPEDVGHFWDAASILKSAGYTLIVSHHMNKSPGGRLRDKASGSTDIMAGSDNGIAIQRPDFKAPAILVTQMRNREADEYPAFGVTFHFDGKTGPITVTHNGKPAVAPQTPGQKILVYLKTVPPGEVVELGQIFGAEILSDIHTTIKSALAVLVKQGHVGNPAKGEYLLLVAVP